MRTVMMWRDTDFFVSLLLDLSYFFGLRDSVE